MKRTFSSSSTWLPISVIHTEKERWMLDFFPPLFSVFRITSWLTSIFPWWSVASLLSLFFLSFSLASLLSFLTHSFFLFPFLLLLSLSHLPLFLSNILFSYSFFLIITINLMIIKYIWWVPINCRYYPYECLNCLIFIQEPLRVGSWALLMELW